MPRFSLRTLMVVMLLGGAVFLSGCGGSACIKFVLPPGFRGPFIIMEDPNGRDGTSTGNDLTITVPPSGIALIKDDALFFRDASRIAVFDDGAPLQLETRGDGTTIALRGGTHSSGLNIAPHHEYYVGTADEYEACDFGKRFFNHPTKFKQSQ
jgi:hypothetical protein